MFHRHTIEQLKLLLGILIHWLTDERFVCATCQVCLDDPTDIFEFVSRFLVRSQFFN